MKAELKTLHYPTSWPTVVVVVVIVLFLVRPDLGTDQIKAVETIVCLLAGSGIAAASGKRNSAPEQGQ